MRCLTCLLFITQVFAAQKVYELTRNANCAGNQPLKATLTVANASEVPPDKVIFSGTMEIREKIPGPIEISFDCMRCDFSMKKCEKYTVIKVPGICDIFKSKGGMFEDMLKAFQPRVACPMMPGKYDIKDSVVDLAPFSVMPAEGFIWMVTLKGISGDGKSKRLAMCMEVEAKISKFRKRKGK